MELEIRKKQAYDTQIASKKTKIKIGTILIGIMLIAVPILITLFITMPDLWQAIVYAKNEILKGIFIGLSTLPVLLFVALKGGETWYKKWWTWIVCVVTVGIVVALSLVGTTSMDPGQDMDSIDIQMGKGL